MLKSKTGLGKSSGSKPSATAKSTAIYLERLRTHSIVKRLHATE
jgi:hypothetical protein